MGIDNLRQFERELDEEFKVEVLDATDKLFSAIVRDMWKFITRDSRGVGLQFGSPVLRGQYYNNHRISVNSIDTTVNLVDAKDFVEGDSPLPPLPLSLATDVLNQWTLGQTVFIANSVPYADDIEAGLSRFKAPEGVYRVAVNAVQIKFRNGVVTTGGF